MEITWGQWRSVYQLDFQSLFLEWIIKMIQTQKDWGKKCGREQNSMENSNSEK